MSILDKIPLTLHLTASLFLLVWTGLEYFQLRKLSRLSDWTMQRTLSNEKVFLYFWLASR